MRDNEYKTHRSWGMIGVSRCSCGGSGFFQSDIPCEEYIQLTIKTAEVKRDFSRDWVMGDEKICQVKLTPMQWAEMLTLMNYNDGVPCTIQYTEKDGYIKFQKEEDKLELLLEESDEKVDKGKAYIESVKNKIVNLSNEKKISKKVAEDLLFELGNANSCLGGHSIDFIKKQAKEHIENMTVQAKANIIAYVDNKIYSTGIKELERLKMKGGHNENT